MAFPAYEVMNSTCHVMELSTRPLPLKEEAATDRIGCSRLPMRHPFGVCSNPSNFRQVAVSYSAWIVHQKRDDAKYIAIRSMMEPSYICIVHLTSISTQSPEAEWNSFPATIYSCPSTKHGDVYDVYKVYKKYKRNIRRRSDIPCGRFPTVDWLWYDI